MSERADNKAGTQRRLIGYLSPDGELKPVDMYNVLPTSGNSTSKRIGIIVEPTGVYSELFKWRAQSLTVVENAIRMFDGSFKTYSTWWFINGLAGTTDPVYIHFGGDAFTFTSLLMYVNFEAGSVSDLAFTAKDKDGTEYKLKTATSTIDISGVTLTQISITGFPDKEVVEVKIERASGMYQWTKIDVYELRFLKKYAFEGSVKVDIPSQRDALSYDDLQDITIAGATADDVTKMFDLDTNSYTEFTPNSASDYVEFILKLKELKKISKIIYLLGANNSPTVTFYYSDGINSGALSGDVYTATVGGASYAQIVNNPYPDKEITEIDWKSGTAGATEDVYEIYAYKENTVDIVNSEIAVPADLQAQYRPVIAETTTALSAGGSFTSSSFDAENYKQLVYILYSDVDGDLYIDESIDGTNWDYTTHIPYEGGSKYIKPKIVKLHSRYVRIRYMNGDKDQTVFRLSVRAEVC